MSRSYVPTLAEIYGNETASVESIVDSYGYGGLVGEVIAEIETAAGLDFVETAESAPSGAIIA